MKELMNIGANFAATFDDKRGLLPSMELIFISSEPRYRLDATGEMIREREIVTSRETCSPETAERIAKVLLKLAAEAREEFEKCAAIKSGLLMTPEERAAAIQNGTLTPP